jgi:hypothetical protein
MVNLPPRGGCRDIPLWSGMRRYGRGCGDPARMRTAEGRGMVVQGTGSAVFRGLERTRACHGWLGGLKIFRSPLKKSLLGTKGMSDGITELTEWEEVSHRRLQRAEGGELSRRISHGAHGGTEGEA